MVLLPALDAMVLVDIAVVLGVVETVEVAAQVNVYKLVSEVVVQGVHIVVLFHVVMCVFIQQVKLKY